MEPQMIDYDFDRLISLGWSRDFVEKMKDDPCWAGYEAVGMKKKGKRMVPNCVPTESKHSEKASSTSEMTPNFLPEEPGSGDEKNPEMGEVGVRMPRSDVLKRTNSKDAQLAMAAKPNYSELFDYFESDEPNGAMAINQLRVMREKIDIMLGMLYPDDNLEPWMSAKLTMSSQNLASVADYLRFGVET
jgi:hypothetical protein